MRFTCPSCGARYGSADEPTSGRVYSIGCRCGRKLLLAGSPSPAGAAAPGPRYDPYAASHGLLLDEAHARVLAAGRPVLEPATQAAGNEVEVTVTFSSLLASPGAEKAEKKEAERGAEAKEAAPRAPPGRWVPPAWSAPAAALLAFVLAGGGTAWFLLPQAGVAPMALILGLSPFAADRSGTPPPAAGLESPAPEPPPPPQGARPAASRPAGPAERRSAGADAAPRGKLALARERKPARTPADRR